MSARYFSLLVVLGLTAVLSAADPVTPERIEQLVKQLSSTKFPEREAAGKELDAIGEPALAALKKAAKSDDVELRRRAEELVTRIERRVELGRLLTPTKLQLDCKDMPVAEAIAELASRSGHPIALYHQGKGIDRKVTVSISETTLWEALEQFCKQARLKEASAIRLTGARDNKTSMTVSPIILQDDAPETLPTCYAGAARVRALPPTTVVRDKTRKAGEALFALGFSLEAKTPLVKIVEARITKAVDENEQALAAVEEEAHRLEPTALQPTFIENVNGRPIGFVGVGDVQVPIRLRVGEKPSKQLKELTGVLKLRVMTPPKSLMTVPDILKARGKRVDCNDKGRLTVTEVERKENGEVHVSVDLTPPVSPDRIVPGGGSVVFVPGPDTEPRLVLVDENGADFPPASLVAQAVTVDGTNKTIIFRKSLVFAPKEGQAAASQLQFRERRLETVEVPFTLKGVPLP